jgi:hypothetical protein
MTARTLTSATTLPDKALAGGFAGRTRYHSSSLRCSPTQVPMIIRMDEWLVKWPFLCAGNRSLLARSSVVAGTGLV